MTEIRNILLIGRTGNGKSTIANVLKNKFEESEEFEYFFEESSGFSGTTSIQSEEFKENGTEYRVIDTIGINDNSGWTNEEIFRKIAKEICSLGGGLNQILFVVKERFDRGDIEAFKSLEDVFGRDVLNCVTIVQTNSDNDEKEIKEEIEKEIGKGGELAGILEDCDKRVISVNNPSLRKDKEHGLKERKESRIKLINHLRTCQGVYELEPRANEAQKDQKISHYSGTFREIVYGGDIKAGEHAVFGKVGVQNFKEVKDQRNYLGEERKEVGQGEQNFQQISQQSQLADPQQKANAEIIQDIRQNPQNWRVDKIIVDLKEINKQENMLIHQSVQLEDNYNQQTWKLNFEGNAIYRVSKFSVEEQNQISQILSCSFRVQQS